ncbi:MAG: hydroxyacid dehydrogenase [Ectobacillus sp.]
MNVLISEVIWEEGIKELEDNGALVCYEEHLWKDRETLLQKVKQFDALIVRNQTRVDGELLDANPNLKVIGRLGVGLDNIDLKAAKERGVQVVYARNANATSVAEYVMNAILTANRPLLRAGEDVRSGNWNRKAFTGGELFTKTIGLIGLGEISHRVARRAKAFGMRVIGYDPYVAEYDHIISETHVEKVELLEELLQAADFVSLHVPLTPATKHLISGRELSMMKQNAYVINTSRGGIVDERALSDALGANRIAGAFLDVLEEEPINPQNPLLQHDNVIITPHIAGLTEESQVRTSVLVAKEVRKLLKGEPSLCLV